MTDHPLITSMLASLDRPAFIKNPSAKRQEDAEGHAIAKVLEGPDRCEIANDALSMPVIEKLCQRLASEAFHGLTDDHELAEIVRQAVNPYALTIANQRGYVADELAQENAA